MVKLKTNNKNKKGTPLLKALLFEKRNDELEKIVKLKKELGFSGRSEVVRAGAKKLIADLLYRYSVFLKLYRYIIFLKNLKYSLIDISEVGIIGNSVRLESCSICQLKCPICSTAERINKEGIVGWGYLKFKDFKKFVDSNPEIKNIELSNWGEIFLNPELKHIIKYAYYKNINLTAGNGVNLNSASREVLEYLVKYKFKWISISIDGATNDTYQIYRRGGDFNRVIENIKIINHCKKKYNTVFPKLSWQFVIMGHNEHELPIAREMAKELGMMEFNPILSWDPSFSPVKDKEFVRRESGLGVASIEEFKQKNAEEYTFVCSQLWKSPQINWDGKLLGCCVNKWGDFGNVFEDGLEKCLKSEKYVYAKRMLMGRKKARNDIPCSKCPTYKNNSGNLLKKKLKQALGVFRG